MDFTTMVHLGNMATKTAPRTPCLPRGKGRMLGTSAPVFTGHAL
ncbi:hypothetical protein RHECNPAF_1740024 [Rhizobium etli CNPAF512]|nr:hypothetical protein RHECNPAF_1740024 [Rhizobium etli CNPAF512]